MNAPTGKIEADFCAENGQTRLSRLNCAAPLKIAKTFARDDGGVSICAMDCSPGLLAGDFYQMDWRVGEGARVEIATQAFTRVHPSRERPCRLETRFEIASGAVLEWFPEPLMLYRDAILNAHSQAHLSTGATFLAGEIWCAGRIERGENFAFSTFQNRWRILRDETPIFASALDLQPQKFDARAIAAWGNWTHSATFFAFSEHADGVLKERFWEILDENRVVYGGATMLPRNGVLVSLLGRRAHDLQTVVSQLRETAREHIFQK